MMDLHLLGARIIQSYRGDGFAAAIRKAFVALARVRRTDDFDRRHGTDTSNIEPLWKFKIDSPNARFGVRYQATDEQMLVDAVSFLPEPPQSFTFIDLGCGKGRTLLVASKLGFRRVIGVEFARELANIARTNLAKMGFADAVVVDADAADFQFPQTDMVVYLYNPFSIEVMRKVVTNLRESNAKRLYVIYRTPECADLFDSSGFLDRLGSPPGRQDIQIWKASASVSR
jgi:predicted RNA methylase